MPPLRLGHGLGHAGALLACAGALAACRASLPPATSTAGGAPVRPPSGFAVARFADSLPITAIAFHAPYVWAGTARGLRRWNVSAARGKSGNDAGNDGDAEVIGAEAGLLGRGIAALGADQDGGVWVATESGIGRLAPSGPSGGARPRYQARGTVTGISLLLPSRGDGGVWAGGVGGLYRYEGSSWTTIDFLRDVAVTSLDLDTDGRAVWVGTRGRGLFLVDDNGGKPILATGAAAEDEEIVGTAPSEGGARVVAIRAGDGGRVVFVTKDGPDEYRTQPGAGTRFVHLLSAGGHPVLIAGAPGAEHLYRLRPLPRGESPLTGGFRLVSTHKGSTARYAATPLAIAAPPEVTVATLGADAGTAAGAATAVGAPEVWLGSRAMGVARAEAPRPRYLSGDLTEGTERLSVACTAIDRCLVVAGGAHAWSYDGAGFREARVGETTEGRALAVIADGAGMIFGVAAQPPWKGLSLTRRTAGGALAASGNAPDDWQVVEKVPLDLGGARPAVSFTAFAPTGNLWLGLGAVTDADGAEEQGRGALEIALGSHHIVRHGATRKGVANPESLPLPYDLTGVIFDGAATWFSSRSGIDRWQESELRHWGENEHMSSEVCFGVGKGTDGKIWAATSGGVGRFDGAEWRFGPGEEPGSGGHVIVRGVINDGAGRMWLATSKGLRVLGEPDASARTLGAGELIVDDEILDVKLDRFGRVWALGAAAIAVVDQPGK
jgi:hypothetical protein